MRRLSKKVNNQSMKIKKISNKIALYTLIPFIIVLIFISTITTLNEFQSEKELIMNRIDNYVNLLESGGVSYQSIANKNEIKEIIGVNVLSAGIVDRESEILYATETFDKNYNSDESEIIENSLNGYVVSYIEDKTFKYYSPLIIKNNVAGVIILSIPSNQMSSNAQNYIYFIAFLDTIGIFIAFILIKIFSNRSIVDKIVKLEEISKRITEGDYQKRIDRELLQVNDEIGNLAKSFEVMRKSINERDVQIKKLLDQKDQFITQLGHDLRTPLSPLINLLPVIEKKEKDPKLKEFLKIISKSTNNLNQVVKKTLKLAQLNSTKISFDTKDLMLVKEVKHAIHRFTSYDIEANISFKNNVSDNIIVQSDSILLGEVFDNLFSNAIKYSPNGGEIKIDAIKKNGYATVSVSDCGIGLNKDQIKYVFDEFYKVDESRHDLKSHGLGMSICKRIIEKQKGIIWVESEGIGKGITIYFTLPTNEKSQNIEMENQHYEFCEISEKIDILIDKN